MFWCIFINVNNDQLSNLNRKLHNTVIRGSISISARLLECFYLPFIDEDLARASNGIEWYQNSAQDGSISLHIRSDCILVYKDRPGYPLLERVWFSLYIFIVALDRFSKRLSKDNLYCWIEMVWVNVFIIIYFLF